VIVHRLSQSRALVQEFAPLSEKLFSQCGKLTREVLQRPAHFKKMAAMVGNRCPCAVSEVKMAELRDARSASRSAKHRLRPSICSRRRSESSSKDEGKFSSEEIPKNSRRAKNSACEWERLVASILSGEGVFRRDARRSSFSL
jgi:hypothetical protein